MNSNVICLFQSSDAGEAWLDVSPETPGILMKSRFPQMKTKPDSIFSFSSSVLALAISSFCRKDVTE